MGFFSRLFGRKKYREEISDDWENLVYDRENVDFQQPEQRITYVTNCLEQIAEATKEKNLLTGEYALVTSYLTDMEEIEALPEEEREELNRIARRLVTLEYERQRYREKKNRMSDSDYYRMRNQEDGLAEGIRKLKEGEQYGVKIKQDLQRLDRERHAYEYRRNEIEAIMNNQRGMAVIFVIAFAVCILMLLVLQFAFDMDAQVGYLLAVGSVCLAVTVVWARYTGEERELGRVHNAINKIIQLQNTVKIRYVNNCNLVDYLYIKYNTQSASELEAKNNRYLEEKEERKQYAEAEAKTEYYQKQLVEKLSKYRVATPDRWMRRPAALLNKGEMVEMRHELIMRRQTLRKQMDYNNNVAETARREIMDIVNQYPAFAKEITDMVEKYEGL